MSDFPPVRTSEHSLTMLEKRAEMYRRFLPEWPALAQSFERDAARIAAELKLKEKKAKP